MQVSCSSCGAKYEFDASAIPAAGYDAQCTTCSAIFFVSPQADDRPAVPSSAASVAPSTSQSPAPPQSSPQVAVSCSHCGAVYQFAAADIPQEGYDAQCTQCQGVFFVSVAGAAKILSGAAAQAPSSEVAPPISTPSGFTQVHELPTVSDDDYASMSQVIAMERLQAGSRQSTPPASDDTPSPGAQPTQTTMASPAVDAELPAAPTSSPEGIVSGEGAAAAPVSDSDGAALPVSEVPSDAPESAVSPAWGLAAPEMAAASSEPEALFAPAAALAASSAPTADAAAFEPESDGQPSASNSPEPTEPTQRADRPSLSDPADHPARPTATPVASAGLEAFSLTPASALVSRVAAPPPAAPGLRDDAPAASLGLHADEPPPPPEPSSDEVLPALEPHPETASAAVAQEDAATMSHADAEPLSPRPEETQAEFHRPSRSRRAPMAMAAAAALAVGGAVFGLWRSGMLAGETAGSDAAMAATAALKSPDAVDGPGDGAPGVDGAASGAGSAAASKARVAFERGMHSLLDDTIAGYTTAQQAFREALKIDAGMVDAYAGLALQALLGGEDYLALGRAEWAEAKRLEEHALAYQAKLLGIGARARRSKEAERERLALAELTQQLGQLREKAMLHLQIGEDTLQSGAMLLLRGSGLVHQTPLMRASMALWLASDPYLANPGESTTSFNAARVQFTEAAQWLMAPGDDGVQGTLPSGADAKDPWARTWMSLAKARILAARPTTAVQVQPFLESAVGREPHFIRGRWEIARAFELSGQKMAAQKAAESLLAVMPVHEKAQALVESIKLADAPASVAAPKSAGKNRGRSHRSRRSRQ